MSEQDDKDLEQIAGSLAISYGELSVALRHLPIPVNLPDGIVTPVVAAEGLLRALDLLEEEPIPAGVRLDIQSACVSWLNAMDLFGMQAVKPRAYRIAGITLCLLTASTGVISAMEWLVDNQED
ncbi:hypothetical protein ACOKM5_20750 [Streptomyces sp. BH097]|uniref:hypothetical protein n=1 Tax=Streptomyces sp. BH097 TaxID=3410406 RepID=UPI003CF52D0F